MDGMEGTLWGQGDGGREETSAAWEEEGQGREEGDALPGRGGRNRGGSRLAGWRVLEHVEGKIPQELSSLGDGERKGVQVAQIPLWAINLRMPRMCRHSPETGS